MSEIDINALNWTKGAGLLPAVIQHAETGAVLMVGFMNREAVARTLSERRVTFFSRSRNCLWTKGETSGNHIDVDRITHDCDRDALLVVARPRGPVCHTGADACFIGQVPTPIVPLAFLIQLEQIIAMRIADMPVWSYTARLFAQGRGRIAQKVGEEALEVALASVAADNAAVLSESADLMFHLLLLLKSRGQSIGEVVSELQARHTKG